MEADWQCFPDRTTPVGKLIDGYLKGEWHAIQTKGATPEDLPLNALAFQALQLANRVEHLDRLRQSPHKTLILDRYWASGYAYGKLDGLDPEWLIQVHQNLPQPSLNILLDVPPSVSVERMKSRGAPPEHYEREEVLWKLRANYQEIWGWGRAKQGGDYWKVVNAVGSKEEVFQRVWEVVRLAARWDTR